MKKIISLFFCCVILAGLLASCAKEETEPTALASKPLFRISAVGGTGDRARLWYLPQSNGFLYLHPTETGFSGGFVSPLRSLSAEGIIDAAGDLEEVIVWETARDRAAIVTPDFAALTLLKEGSSQITPMPEKFGVEAVYPFDTTSFLAKSKHLLLKIPVTLENAFVLADTDLLDGFAAPIGTADGTDKIYYATGKEGAFDGTAFFEYGKNLPLGKESFSFTSVKSLAGGAVLLQKDEADKTVCRFFDPAQDLRRDMTVDGVPKGAAASPSGTLLCTLEKGDGGDAFAVYNMETNKKIAVLPLPGATAVPSFALSERTLFFAVTSGDELIFYTADLEKIL